jgi:hypothetical protein
MGVRQRTQEIADRLKCKTLDDRFRNEIVAGMSCSPFEAEAVLEVVKEIYFPFLDELSPKMPPGRVSLMAICADEPAGKPVSECTKQTVCLTVHRGEIDDQLLLLQGATQFRRARLVELCQEALSQGALLTSEDLAYHIFFVSPRTISRDLAALRQDDPLVVIPLRSMVHDIGPVLTHRVHIVRLALEGKTTSQICDIMRHSPTAVANYLSTFTRVVQLQRKKMQTGQIAFVLRRGRSLIRQYQELLQQCEQDKNMAYHLDELLRLGNCGEGKKRTARREGHE